MKLKFVAIGDVDAEGLKTQSHNNTTKNCNLKLQLRILNYLTFDANS